MKNVTIKFDRFWPVFAISPLIACTTYHFKTILL